MDVGTRTADGILPRAAWRPWRAPRGPRALLAPLVRLLRYVGPHRGWALLTAAFGTLGFLLSFAYPWIVGSVVDLVAGTPGATPDGAARLRGLVELALGTAVLHALVVYGRGHCNVHLGDAIVTDLRRDLFAHLQRLSVGFYARERTGSILSRVVHDVHEATAVIYMGLMVAGMDALQLALAFVLMAAISPKLTLACLAVFPAYGVVFRIMNPRVRRASERVQSQLGTISGNVAEQVSGQALVKTCTAEARETARFGSDVATHHRLVVAQSHEGHLVASSGEVLVHLGTTIVIGYGGWLALGGEMTAGMLTRFLGYVVILYGPVRRFAELNTTYQQSLAAIRRVFRVLDIRPAVDERPRAVRHAPTRGHVRFERVRFRYATDTDEARARLDDDGAEAPHPAAAPWVLEDITLDVAPGERVAVVGPSGAGKTTLCSLVPRLHDVSGGRLLVDGIDVRAYGLRALRGAIGVVQQDPFIFTGTVRENIAYGRPDATPAEIVAAARAAHAEDFIGAFPDGFATRLGERGVNLSGGQRQRIAIARALLRDPRILILDEATSALDAESERLVQEALEVLMRHRTCFVIAHRLSTIRTADRIVVLDHGHVVESGTHAALLARGGTYARLVGRQATVPACARAG